MGGHLVAEAIRLGARYLCPIDGLPLETRGEEDTSRWGHYNKAMNEWHTTPPKEKTDA